MSRSFAQLNPFLIALQAQIVAADIWASSCTILSMHDSFPEYPVGSPLLIIIPQDFSVWGQDGGGIEQTVLDGRLLFKIVVQSTVDPVFTDSVTLTGNTDALSLYQNLDDLLDTVQMLDLCGSSYDNSGSYLIEPMRLVSISRPRRDETHSQYTWLDVVFNIRLDQYITGD